MTAIESNPTKSSDATDPRRPSIAKTRDWRSDLLKGISIVGVVSIHAGMPAANVLRFCVPVFVAIWAYYYELGLARRSEASRYVGSRFLQLLIPYAFWTSIYLLLFHSFSEWRTTPIYTIVGGWLGGFGWAGQYFFIVLFQLTWLFPAIRRLVTPTTLGIVLIAGALGNAATNYWLFENRLVVAVHDRLFIYWLPYVFLGTSLARGYPRRLPALLIVTALAILATPWEYAKLLATNHPFSPYLLMTVSISSFTLLIAAGARSPDTNATAGDPEPRLASPICYLGRNSMPIYVGHLLVLTLLSYVVATPEGLALSIVYRAALIGIAIAGSVWIGWLLRKVGLSILVGK
ncbi:acyltransferase [Blastopirellula retiformator]|uniref:Acyltransferase family protein n=1 Tax=Blastopirellula retiformator TaxID=2527970 RepID=A0A5C5V813_9BACT|nr:acyltransferase [Blastopirellula retiformator]TWT34103.1 Acyltransferase family protein [Blastopirellula retiformator]